MKMSFFIREAFFNADYRQIGGNGEHGLARIFTLKEFNHTKHIIFKVIKVIFDCNGYKILIYCHPERGTTEGSFRVGKDSVLIRVFRSLKPVRNTLMLEASSQKLEADPKEIP
ncbi:hypothetical protein [Lutispora saccharofermentans]|uniref:Uncharacterized protein n=1 Tax=Lutispora saccharofermentans TaxID=3024236 RepID=A0ABT1NBX7_9FIRM|nr:hypothetical protein [Lutispora saccharofermentans]MCQ1528534.1 hypothetical protein [Lutispora saccharofermentans]